MRGERVVITGMGAVSPYGGGVECMVRGLRRNACALSPLPEQEAEGLCCRVAGRVPPVDAKRIPRELRRSMSPMSVFACLAAWEALEQAALPPAPQTRTGVAVGSTLGSPGTLQDFFSLFLHEGNMDSARSTVFFKVMGHSVAANVAQACGCTGRMLAPSMACSSGLAAICLGYEAIAAGREEIMLCGGADEFHPLVPATFARLGAASEEADPRQASLPFDKKRAGLVCSEGAGILVLESLRSAQARNAPVLAEVLGAALLSSPGSIAHPDAEAIGECMRQALDDAGIGAESVGYVNAHATATESGDMAEGRAIEKLFGPKVPVSSLKGHMGHTMAASGALESILCVAMLRDGLYAPTRGLHDPDPRCGNPGHFFAPLRSRNSLVLKNSFALGGCHCSIVLDMFRQAPYNTAP